MIDVPTAALLQNILRRESRSLLQYVSEAFPWTTVEERGALANLRKLITDEQTAIAELARFLIRQRVGVPHLGAYPDFTAINFVTLDFLLPMLADHQNKAIAVLERNLAQVIDPDARALVEKILTMKRQHLETLKSMAAPHPAKPAA